MPRANRYLLPGYTYHLTHRCHNRSFLFRFAKDRTEYSHRLRAAVRAFDVSLLTFCVTSNHTHLLAKAATPEQISALMQKLEGEFAEYYNIRKKRSGAFWEGRYHCTMIEDGVHLWNCMRYIDLNMVRAGIVKHPSEWSWCGYRELTGIRQRYRMLDEAEILGRFGAASREKFGAYYREVIGDALRRCQLSREAIWTESIAVGSESFVNQIGEETRNRRKLSYEALPGNQWVVRETPTRYGSFSGRKNGSKPQCETRHEG